MSPCTRTEPTSRRASTGARPCPTAGARGVTRSSRSCAPMAGTWAGWPRTSGRPTATLTSRASRRGSGRRARVSARPAVRSSVGTRPSCSTSTTATPAHAPGRRRKSSALDPRCEQATGPPAGCQSLRRSRRRDRLRQPGRWSLLDRATTANSPRKEEYASLRVYPPRERATRRKIISENLVRDVGERLAHIQNMAQLIDPGGPAGRALWCIDALIEVVRGLADRVEALEAECNRIFEWIEAEGSR